MMVERLLGLAVRQSVFGVFEVLDGSVKSDPEWEPGDHFELRHIHGRRVDVILGPETPLHEYL